MQYWLAEETAVPTSKKSASFIAILFLYIAFLLISKEKDVLNILAKWKLQLEYLCVRRNPWSAAWWMPDWRLWWTSRQAPWFGISVSAGMIGFVSPFCHLSGLPTSSGCCHPASPPAQGSSLPHCTRLNLKRTVNRLPGHEVLLPTHFISKLKVRGGEERRWRLKWDGYRKHHCLKA